MTLRIFQYCRFAMFAVCLVWYMPSVAWSEAPGRLLQDFGGGSGVSRRMVELQTELVWAGFLSESPSGTMDQATKHAIIRFQAGQALPKSGLLTERGHRILASKAKMNLDAAGFQWIEDHWTGIGVEIPFGLVDPATAIGEDKENIRYQGKYDRFGLDIRLLVSVGAGSPDSVIERLVAELEKDPDIQILSRKVIGRSFRIAYRDDDYYFLAAHEIDRMETRSVVVRYQAQRAALFGLIASRIIESFDGFGGKRLPASRRRLLIDRGEYPQGRAVPDWYRSVIINGSGSIVSFNGHILTNEHVVQPCNRLTVNGDTAELIGADFVNDLALLHTERFENRIPVRFRSGEAELGETVIVMGYPIFDLTRSLNVTSGIVSSTHGPWGDRTRIQVTAPVQPSNSGGPVLDVRGDQVAVLVSKPSSEVRQQRNVENVAWAIRNSVIRDFLLREGVVPVEAKRDTGAVPTMTDLVNFAREFTVRVECHSP